MEKISNAAIGETIYHIYASATVTGTSTTVSITSEKIVWHVVCASNSVTLGAPSWASSSELVDVSDLGTP